jgi:ParB family chromosome partitioning protein
MIASLLERGEERLVSAVETGLIPITLAMEISKAETEEAQNLLLDAYETGKLQRQEARRGTPPARHADAQPTQGWIACRAVGPKGTGVRG